MNLTSPTDRRQFLKLVGTGSLGLALPSGGVAQRRPLGAAAAGEAAVAAEIDLVAGFAHVPILPGPATRVAQFTAGVVAGDPGALRPSASYLGPTIEVESGQSIRVRFRNRIDGPSIVHWHGLHLPMEADGHPSNAIEPGQEYLYDLRVRNRAGLYWYHPHPHEHTGEQVNSGLAGLFVVRDEEERSLGLPGGDEELLLMLQDRRFDEDNQLQYKSSLREIMNGFLGDRVLVNGRPGATTSVATRPYRMRLVNGSSARIYKLGWSDGTPLTVIGSDGGLLETPLEKPYVALSPAERVDLWVDFSDRPLGTELEMRSLAFTDVAKMEGMMGGGGGDQRAVTANGEELVLLRIRVDRRSDVRATLPRRLCTIPRHTAAEALEHGGAIPVRLDMEPMRALINGRSFEMTEVAPEERVKLGSTRLFVLENAFEEGVAMTMPHPMHFHGQQFQVLRREAGPNVDPGYATLSAGLVDEGWKDTVLVFPGERVTIAKRFDDFTGLFLYHCHNLEHEDLGMMRNLEVHA